MTTDLRPSKPPKYLHREYRNVFPLPLADKFFNMLQDRLQMVVENVLFEGDTRFSLLINIVGRSREQRYLRNESPDFVYAGLDMQKELLGREALDRWGKMPEDTAEIRQAWKYLAETTIKQENSEVSKSFYQKIKNGTLGLEDIGTIETLKDYFAKDTKTYTEEQRAERAILSNYFDIKEDLFLAIPLFGFAEFDGVVYIVFKKELTKNFSPAAPEKVGRSLIWTLLRAFIAEYDGLFLDWDLEGENVEKISAINEFVTTTIMNEGLDEHFGLGKAPLVAELRLLHYYRTHRTYLKSRIDTGEDVPGKMQQQYITHAVSSILVDSYAHNVSAHALSTLSWWYYRRAKMLRDEEVDWDALVAYLRKDKEIDENLLKAFASNIEKRREKRREQARNANQLMADVPKEAIRVEDGERVIRYPGSLARELAQLLRFLTEKGAYWSGVARDANVGGKVSTLYSILWYDFINNPFYVGTIAKTEDILKVHLRIVLYDKETEEQRTNQTYYHDKTFQPENNGIFATVDLADPYHELHNDPTKTHDEVRSAFVKKGEDFDRLKDKLKAIKIFFPGGIVGRHAFFTMIENEMRNVKHYDRERLRELQENGLTVALGIQECSLHGSQKGEIYRFSIWLEAPSDLNKGGEHLLLRKWVMLRESIINDARSPKLGGSYQDKVCASFLFNGFFSHVQRGDRNPDRDTRFDTTRDQNYYPWVRPACSTEENEIPNGHRDYKISYNNPSEPIMVKKNPDDPYSPEREEIRPMPFPNLPRFGYAKKVFYLWRGETLLDWAASPKGQIKTDASWDNPSRYTIVNLPGNAPDDAVDDLRHEKGVVRIVQGVDPASTDRFTEAYTKWLSLLFGPGVTALRLDERKPSDPSLSPHYDLVLDYSSASPSFEHCPHDQGMPAHIRSLFSSSHVVEIVHKGDEIEERRLEARYRNHGIYRSFFSPKDFNTIPEPQKTHRMLEFFEVLKTRVCVFDNRVQHRLRIDDQKITNGEKTDDPYRLMLRDKLHLGVYNEALEKDAVGSETVPAWLSQLDENDCEFVKNCHFLVMHLSFIERILEHGLRGQKGDTSDVGDFIDRHLLPFVGRRDNFFLVITTGRGRNEWWSNIGGEKHKDKGFTRFVLFRPVESLLAVIENSVNMQDDIELKYRISKVLYGS